MVCVLVEGGGKNDTGRKGRGLEDGEK